MLIRKPQTLPKFGLRLFSCVAIICFISFCVGTATAESAGPPAINSPGSITSPGPTLTTLAPTFTWTPVAGATDYGLYIRDVTFDVLVYPNASGTTTTRLTGRSYTLPSGYLVNGHRYRWAMTTFRESTASAQSPVLYFQTPAAPTLGLTTTPAPASTLNVTDTPAAPMPSVTATPASAPTPGITVTQAPAPTLSFTATPASIAAGQSAALDWSSTNASGCTALGGWTGTRIVIGSEVVSPSATTTYTLACSGAGGIAGNTVTVAVASRPGQMAQVTRQAPDATSAQTSHFTWPTDPQNASNGYYSICGDWPGIADGCYWISANGWRDANPFQRHYNPAPVPGYHLGADWNFASSAAELPVYAVADGTISSVRPNVSGWGNIVFIRHNTPWGIYTSMYAHVNWAIFGMPLVNQTVSWGQQIAVIRNASGMDANPLHLEIRAGDNTDPGPGYTNDRSIPQSQIDPNLFISTHR